jgi:hypothetical protein
MKDGIKRLIKGPYWDSAVADKPEPMSRAQLRREVRGHIVMLGLVLAVGGYWLIGTHHHAGAIGVAAETLLVIWLIHTARLAVQLVRIRRRAG